MASRACCVVQRRVARDVRRVPARPPRRSRGRPRRRRRRAAGQGCTPAAAEQRRQQQQGEGEQAHRPSRRKRRRRRRRAGGVAARSGGSPAAGRRAAPVPASVAADRSHSRKSSRNAGSTSIFSSDSVEPISPTTAPHTPTLAYQGFVSFIARTSGKGEKGRGHAPITVDAGARNVVPRGGSRHRRCCRRRRRGPSRRGEPAWGTTAVGGARRPGEVANDREGRERSPAHLGCARNKKPVPSGARSYSGTEPHRPVRTSGLSRRRPAPPPRDPPADEIRQTSPHGRQTEQNANKRCRALSTIFRERRGRWWQYAGIDGVTARADAWCCRAARRNGLEERVDFRTSHLST